MPVDKFGRSHRGGPQAIQTHITHVTTQPVNKEEDFLLNIGSDNVRSMGCIDLTENKMFSFNLGDQQNSLRYTKDREIILQTTGPVNLQEPDGRTIFQFNNALGQNEMHRDLKCNNRYITNLHDPVEMHDAATKNYVQSYIKQHREFKTITSVIPNAPFTDIVLMHFPAGRRKYVILNVYVERNPEEWFDVTCAMFGEQWKNFQLFIKNDSLICYFTSVATSVWSRKYQIYYMLYPL
jgi:hypothetical protein